MRFATLNSEMEVVNVTYLIIHHKKRMIEGGERREPAILATKILLPKVAKLGIVYYSPFKFVRMGYNRYGVSSMMGRRNDAYAEFYERCHQEDVCGAS